MGKGFEDSLDPFALLPHEPFLEGWRYDFKDFGLVQERFY